MSTDPDQLRRALLGPPKPQPGRCGGLNTKGRPCRMPCKVVEFNPGGLFDFSQTRYWVLDGCAAHASDVSRGLFEVVEAYGAGHRESAALLREVVDKAREYEVDASLLRADVARMAGQFREWAEPACWSWDRPGPHLKLAPATRSAVAAELEAGKPARAGASSTPLGGTPEGRAKTRLIRARADLQDDVHSLWRVKGRRRPSQETVAALEERIAKRRAELDEAEQLAAALGVKA